MAFTYDDQNIFAKILRGEIPNTTVYESDHVLAFNDIAPAADVHILVIPKGPYVSFDHFAGEASAEEQVAFMQAIAEITAREDLGQGFRAIANTREHGAQDVPHFHMHILGGRPLGPMLAKPAQ